MRGSKVLTISPKGARTVEQSKFSELLSEQSFEEHLIQAPEVLGEDLLLLGRQLREFEEDAKRLDLLAVDAGGEIVLIELKAADGFEFTDLQAIGYAGAYSKVDTVRLAETLLGSATADSSSTQHVPGEGIAAGSGVEDAKATICSFLGIDEFNEWEPSQHVRIKLVAPEFPKRVLMNVRWLHDLYGMHIEAIRVTAFPGDSTDEFNLIFDRVLPLPGDEEFSLTFKKQADQVQAENQTRARNKNVLPLLLEAGVVKDGDLLVIADWSALPKHKRDLWDPNDPLFQVRVDAETRKVRWKPSDEDEELLLRPGRLASHIYERVIGEPQEPFSTSVGGSFLKGTDGPTLEALAVEHGLWTYDD